MATRTTARKRLVELKVRVPSKAEEPVSLELERRFGSWPVGFSAPESEITHLSLFLPAEEKPTRAVLSSLTNSIMELLQPTARAKLKIDLKPLINRNWKESWKRHFKPQEIGHRLLLRPSWSRRKARPGQSVVVLDPGLSFGTGQHPTTFFCLRETVWARIPHSDQSFLDMGTGSGILAIAAAKLGYQPVHAFDCDPDSVRVAGNNAKRNRVAQKINIQRADLSQSPMRTRSRFDVVCVNILADILLAERRKILNRVTPGGTLVLAGILAREFDKLEEGFTSMGALPLRHRTEGEWKSASYRVPA